MSPDDVLMHLRAGAAAGRKSTCGTKIKHPSEEAAQRHADSLNRRSAVISGERGRCEPYPCAFCSDPEADDFTWHVGREMTAEERSQFIVSELSRGWQRRARLSLGKPGKAHHSACILHSAGNSS